MALPRDGTIDWTKITLTTEWPVPLHSEILRLINEKAPCYVHYACGRHTFTRPDQFYIRPLDDGPSDCRWMVPGTAI